MNSNAPKELFSDIPLDSVWERHGSYVAGRDELGEKIMREWTKERATILSHSDNEYGTMPIVVGRYEDGREFHFTPTTVRARFRRLP